MANFNNPLPQEIIDYVAQFPADAIAKVRPNSSRGFIATVDVGPRCYVSDADAPRYAATPEEACEQVKAWLLDDLACGGRLGKRHYQPHWDAYDIKYRLGAHWESKVKGKESHDGLPGTKVQEDR